MIYTHEAQEGGKNKNLGNTIPWQDPTLLPIPCSLPKTQKSNERGCRDYTKGVCGLRESWNRIKGGKEETQCLTGRKGKVILSNIPRDLAESWDVGGPAAKCP